MPSHRIHRLIDRLLLGEEQGDVHRFLDSLAFLGKSHRRLPPHDLFSLVIYARGDAKKLLAGLVHLMLDEAESKAKRSRARRARTYGAL